MKSHTFCFNPRSNGGEQVTLTTKFIDHGKGDWSIEQKLEMIFLHDNVKVCKK